MHTQRAIDRPRVNNGCLEQKLEPEATHEVEVMCFSQGCRRVAATDECPSNFFWFMPCQEMVPLMCLSQVHFSVPHFGKKKKQKPKSVSVSASANLGVSGYECECECVFDCVFVVYL